MLAILMQGSLGVTFATLKPTVKLNSTHIRINTQLKMPQCISAQNAFMPQISSPTLSGIVPTMDPTDPTSKNK